MAFASAPAKAAVFVLLAAVAAALSASSESAQRPMRRDLLVAAAASVSGIAPQLTQAFHDASGIDVRFNFGGSNTLARQIVEGARVDVFVSADAAQMDVVERSGRLVSGTRVSVVSNQLVVIVPSAPNLIFKVDDLASPRTQRVAMGDPAAVPAGVYGRQWLEVIRLWSMVEPKVVPLPSSPAVVAAVRAGRADAGVVYASDAHDRRDVRVAYLVPFEDAPEILYPAAAITGGRRIALACQFIDFLRSAPAQRIFESVGFRPVGSR